MSEKPPNLPPNRKSCFQITNVQEAASTESLDDPDESQTEGANISQADLGVCDQNLSEGTLNNVGEQQEGQPASIGPVNRGVSVNSGGGVPVPPARQPSIPSLTQANPVATGTMSATTCSSRFRKVKVPSCFLRGRWKCTEFYGRDSDNMDYSRLGVTGGSVVISAGSADSGQSGASSLQPIGCSTALPQHPQHAQVNIPQTHPSSLNGDGASNGTQQFVYSSQAGGITGGYPDHQQQQFAPLQPQGSNTQNLPMAPPSVGPPDSQEPSPVITPVVPGAQGQGMVAHSGGEVASASGAHGGTPAGPPVSISSQAEDRRRKSDVPQPSPGTLSGNVGMDSEGFQFPDSLFGHAIAEKINQVMDVVKSNLMYAIREEMLKAKITELSKRNLELESENSILKSLANTDQLSQLPPSQGTTPDITPVGPESQGMSMVTQGGEAASVQGVMPVGSGTSIGSVPLIPSAAVTPATIAIHSGVQNVTATVPPSNILTPPDMLGQTPSAAGLIQSQGAHRGVPLGLSAALSILAEDSRQTSDFLPQPTTDALLKKDGRKPFLSESLGPPNPTVERIPIDGEEESTSDASVMAIDNKIEQALDLVKNHLTYAVREEIELLKEKIKEQYSKNSVLEHENTLLKSLVKTDQLDQAQGRDTASSQEPMLQVGSGASMESVLLGIPPATTTTTTHSSVQNVTATVSSTTKPPGILGQPQSAGGLVQAPGAHGGAPVGLPVGISSQAEDSRQWSDFLPQPSIAALREKDGIKPVISENIIPPTVDSLFNIPIDEGSASHASVVAIDNKIEQALDLVKSHLMNAVQEEVEVLKEQIKEQYGRNSVLDHENTVLKSLLNTDQLSQLSTQISPMVRTSPSQQQLHPSAPATNNTSNDPLVQHEGTMSGSQPDYQQQQFGPLQPQGSKTQILPMASLSGRPTDTQGSSPVITPVAQGLGKEAQGGEAASAQVGSVGASTCSVPPGVPSTSAVTPATVPSPTNTPPGVLSQAPSSGGLVQAKGACGGSLVGLSVDVSSQAEDSRQRTSAVIAEPSTDNLSVNKDAIKPFISESFGIPFPFDKKVEQAMDLVKSHLMYAVQEEMELLKEQIKEQSKRNSVLEQENTLLKSLANTDQLSQLSSQISPVLHHPATTINNTSVPLAQHDQEQTSPPTSPTSHRHDPNPPPQ